MNLAGENPILSVVFISLLLFVLVVPPVSAADIQDVECAPLNPAFVAYLEEQESEISDADSMLMDGDDISHNTGLIPAPVTLVWPEDSDLDRCMATSDYEVPSEPYFNLRNENRVTPVKDQSPYGSCWTFASLGSLESTLLTDTGDAWDFSENNMMNTHGFDWGPYIGGNNFMSTAYLARWSGPVRESDDPYNRESTVSPEGLSPVFHVQNVTFLPPRSDSLDNDQIKSFIKNEGGLNAGFAVNRSCFDHDKVNYYMPMNCTRGGGHAILLVGWDDSYPAENFNNNPFNQIPSVDGAFIAKNSYGTGSGDGGYFYISYYDKTIGRHGNDYVALFTAETQDNYDREYSYDPLGWTSSYGIKNTTFYGKNDFTSEGYENLEAVSFYTREPEVRYEIRIVLSPESEPETVLVQDGTMSLPGYHTLPLVRPVALSQGEDFGVILKVISPTDHYPLAIEMPLNKYSSRATASPGESFVSLDGENWTDLTKIFPDSNVCIKAFTREQPSLNADLTSNVTSARAPLTVQFSDVSTGTPTSWSWDFGDDVTSTEQNPVHTYTDVGSYDVSLAVENACDSSIVTKNGYVTAFARSDDRIVSPGDSIFVYEQDLVLSGLRYEADDPVTALVKYVDDADPYGFNPKSEINRILVEDDADFDVSDNQVDGEYGMYYVITSKGPVSDNPTRFVYIYKPELGLDVTLAGSGHSESIDAKSVSRDSEIAFRLSTTDEVSDSDRIDPEVSIEVTTPGGAKTTTFGTADLSDIRMESSALWTDDLNRTVDLSDAEAGTYSAQAKWVSPAGFRDYADRSNSVTFSLTRPAVIRSGDSIFEYERSLDLSGLRYGANKPVASLVKYAEDADPYGSESRPEINRIVVTDDRVFDVPQIHDDSGLYYVITRDGPAGGESTHSINIYSPDLALGVTSATSHADYIDGKSISHNADITFKLMTRLVAGESERISPEARIRVTTPDGAKTTSLGGADLSIIPMNHSRVWSDDIDLSDLDTGDYSAQAEWLSPAGFSDYADKSNTVKFSVIMPEVVEDGDTIFIYETGLDLSGLRYADNEPVTALVKYVDDKVSGAEINRISVAEDTEFDLLNSMVGDDCGLYYAITENSPAKGEPGHTVSIQKPDVTLGLTVAESHLGSFDGESIYKNWDVAFRIASRYTAVERLNAAVDIEVTTPGGSKTTSFGTADLSNIQIGNPVFWTDDLGRTIDLTDLDTGDYSAQARWSSPVGFRDYANKSNVVKFSLGEYEPEPGQPVDSIHLYEGGNFISVPRLLAAGNNTAAIFEDVKTADHPMIRYNASTEEWSCVSRDDPLLPMEGFWIYSTESRDIPLHYDAGYASLPPTRSLYAGWNAIGLSDAVPAPACAALISVEDQWDILIGYNAGTQEYETSVIRGKDGIHSEMRKMNPTTGYWLYMKEDGNLAAIGA